MQTWRGRCSNMWLREGVWMLGTQLEGLKRISEVCLLDPVTMDLNIKDEYNVIQETQNFTNTFYVSLETTFINILVTTIGFTTQP
ncbi:hypothetical protein E2C01_043650 [Portunus trituberculatus]|uniref:Uncharacterized protein n=1 Tax=Portunus trituberculatus TaxID=210409 RepID=A0A5B7FW88_PORTR|nr:hypothetical protein [Portunus trituberculatus]